MVDDRLVLQLSKSKEYQMRVNYMGLLHVYTIPLELEICPMLTTKKKGIPKVFKIKHSIIFGKNQFRHYSRFFNIIIEEYKVKLKAMEVDNDVLGNHIFREVVSEMV